MLKIKNDFKWQTFMSKVAVVISLTSVVILTTQLFYGCSSATEEEWIYAWHSETKGSYDQMTVNLVQESDNVIEFSGIYENWNSQSGSVQIEVNRVDPDHGVYTGQLHVTSDKESSDSYLIIILIEKKEGCYLGVSISNRLQKAPVLIYQKGVDCTGKLSL